MRLLIIGGSRFSGYFATLEALRRGHEVTVFNRGNVDNPDFAEVEQIHGDRNTDDLQQLRGRTFDAVLDMVAFVPRHVQRTADLLRGRVGQYLFVSSISAYAEPYSVGMDENSLLGALEDASIEEVTGETYGPLKALCEQVAEENFPYHTTIVRPGLIVGPRDPTNRFDYWVDRVAAGGEVLAPVGPDYLMQAIDARDLGAWFIHLLETRTVGTFNAISAPYSFETFFDTIRTVSGSDAVITYVPEDFLITQSVEYWSDLPFWLPSGDAPFLQASNVRAISAGLRISPLELTITDTLAWINENREAYEARRTALTPEREADILAAWHAREAHES